MKQEEVEEAAEIPNWSYPYSY